MKRTRKWVWLLAVLAIAGTGADGSALAGDKNTAKGVVQKNNGVKAERQVKTVAVKAPAPQLAAAQRGGQKKEAIAPVGNTREKARDKARLAKDETPRLARPAPARGERADVRVARASAARSPRGEIVAARAKPENSVRSRNVKLAAAVPAAVPARNGSSMQQKRNLHRLLVDNEDLWQEPGQLAVSSGSALVVAQDGGGPLYEKNAGAVVSIASITKLMTAMVVLDSMASLQALVTIGEEDVDYLRGSRSRLPVGAAISRETALLLALMSSENRAANALARHYPGGLPAFVAAMNRKAATLGMTRTHFEDPTGLDSNNVSTAHDLARMVAAAHRYPLIREFSTTAGYRAEVNGRDIEYHNTNQLVSSPHWEIGLSKTGYIREAGKCLVMQARVAEKPVVIVLLDANGKQTRIGDANRIKRWMESASASGRVATRV